MYGARAKQVDLDAVLTEAARNGASIDTICIQFPVSLSPLPPSAPLSSPHDDGDCDGARVRCCFLSATDRRGGENGLSPEVMHTE